MSAALMERHHERWTQPDSSVDAWDSEPDSFGNRLCGWKRGEVERVWGPVVEVAEPEEKQ